MYSDVERRVLVSKLSRNSAAQPLKSTQEVANKALDRLRQVQTSIPGEHRWVHAFLSARIHNNFSGVASYAKLPETSVTAQVLHKLPLMAAMLVVLAVGLVWNQDVVGLTPDVGGAPMISWVLFGLFAVTVVGYRFLMFRAGRCISAAMPEGWVDQFIQDNLWEMEEFFADRSRAGGSSLKF